MESDVEQGRKPREEHSLCYKLNILNFETFGKYWKRYAYNEVRLLYLRSGDEIQIDQDDDALTLIGALYDFTYCRRRVLDTEPVQVVQSIFNDVVINTHQFDSLSVGLAIALAERGRIDEIDTIQFSDNFQNEDDQCALITLAVAEKLASQGDVYEAMRLIQIIRETVGENNVTQNAFDRARYAIDLHGTGLLSPMRSW